VVPLTKGIYGEPLTTMFGPPKTIFSPVEAYLKFLPSILTNLGTAVLEKGRKVALDIDRKAIKKPISINLSIKVAF